jgi:hypothetical protein
MSMMLLSERRSMESEYVMRHFAKDDIFMRFVHCGKSGAREFGMLVVSRRRARLLIAGIEAELRMKDECILACIRGHLASRPAVRRIWHRRVVDNGAAVAIVGKFEVGERIGTVEIQRRAVRSIRHGEHAIRVAIVDRVEIESFEIDLIGT